MLVRATAAIGDLAHGQVIAVDPTDPYIKRLLAGEWIVPITPPKRRKEAAR